MREQFRWIAVALLLAAANVAWGQTGDSLVVNRATQSNHSPTGALWRSALLPGLGQIYNRQPIKAPIIAAGLVGLTVVAVHNDRQFDLYNRAYLYGAYLGEDPHPFPEYEDEYLKFPGVSTSALRSRRDRYKRNRDLTIIGTVIAYGLNVLDAYVGGHLVDFDVGEDLSAISGVEPVAIMSFRVTL